MQFDQQLLWSYTLHAIGFVCVCVCVCVWCICVYGVLVCMHYYIENWTCHHCENV